MMGSAGSGVEEGASSAAGAGSMPTASSPRHAKEAPSSPLALKKLLPEGSCMSMAPATKKNAMSMWACSPNGEMKVRAVCVWGKKHGGKQGEAPRALAFFLGCQLSHGDLAAYFIACRL